MAHPHLSHAAAAAIALGALLGTSACASPSPATEPSPPPAAAAAPSERTHASSALEAECALVTAANSIMLNADADRSAGRVTAKEYAAVLNTVPQVLFWRPKGLPKAVQLEADALAREVGPPAAGDTGPGYEPMSRAVRAAVGDLYRTCDANGIQTGVLATSGG